MVMYGCDSACEQRNGMHKHVCTHAKGLPNCWDAAQCADKTAVNVSRAEVHEKGLLHVSADGQAPACRKLL